jgi:hypothetical protein
MKTILLSCLALAVCLSQPALAQYENYAVDGLLFSSTNFGGTARSMGLAGAQTALGADLSSAASNPAGLGMCRRSEFVFSPMLGYGNSSSNLNNANLSANYNNFALGNMGAIFSFAKDDLAGGKWRGGSLAVSMSRIKDFNNNIGFSGVNTNNSMTDYFIQTANGTNDQLYFDEGKNGTISSLQSLAYNTFVINPVNPGGDNRYQTLGNMKIAKVNQSGYVNTKGRINEWDFAGGLNYDDKIYLGAAIGVMGIHYEEDKLFKEKISESTPSVLNSFALQEGRTVNGSGVKISGGIIAKPNDHFKIGLSLTSPTIYTMEENFKATTMTSSNVANYYYPGDTLPMQTSHTATMGGGSNRYTLTTPGIAKLGLAYTNKYGLLSAEVASVNYAGMNIQDGVNALTYSSANNFAASNFKSTINTNIGAELKLEDIRIRAGYAYYGDPSAGIDHVNRAKQFLTLGAGFRNQEYFVDIAYIASLTNSVYSPYTLANGNGPSVTSQNNNTNIMLSCGLFF